jgi:ATP-binding cassette subfamily B protein RaxB
MMAIKLNMRENERRVAYQNLVVEHINANVNVQSVGIFQRGGQALIFGIESVIIVWLAALLVMDGKFSVGMLYAFIGFKLVFLSRVNNLIEKWNEFRMLDLHAERIADIALAEPEAGSASISSVTGAAGGTKEALRIEAKNLGYAYGPEGFAFRHVNLEIHPNESVALVGPSGCGKTTLLKVLLGLLPPTEGQVMVNGRDLKDWDMAQYRALIGGVMQDDQLFIGSIGDAIAFGGEFDMAAIQACAEAADIHADIVKMPMGYSTFVGALGSSLSGGQKQRVLLARALYRKPVVLFLDETLDQVDSTQESQIRDRLKDIVPTVVMVSHRPESIVGSRQILIPQTNFGQS